MRATVVIFVFAALLAPACSVSAGEADECTPLPLGLEVTQGTSSCAASVEHDGHVYVPWCVGVQPNLLSTDAELSGGDVNVKYRARFIDGVAVEDAIAISLRIPNARKQERRTGRLCGVWQLAPSVDLSEADGKAIARQVGVPGSPGLR